MVEAIAEIRTLIAAGLMTEAEASRIIAECKHGKMIFHCAPCLWNIIRMEEAR